MKVTIEQRRGYTFARIFPRKDQPCAPITVLKDQEWIGGRAHWRASSIDLPSSRIGTADGRLLQPALERAVEIAAEWDAQFPAGSEVVAPLPDASQRADGALCGQQRLAGDGSSPVRTTPPIPHSVEQRAIARRLGEIIREALNDDSLDIGEMNGRIRMPSDTIVVAVFIALQGRIDRERDEQSRAELAEERAEFDALLMRARFFAGDPIYSGAPPVPPHVSPAAYGFMLAEIDADSEVFDAYAELCGRDTPAYRALFGAFINSGGRFPQ